MPRKAGGTRAVKKPGRPAKKRHWQRKLLKPVDRRPPEPERDLTTGQVRTREAARALSRMRAPTLAAHAGIKVTACEGFSPYNQQRVRWTKQRVREFAQLYGNDLSVGVGGCVRNAAWGHAFGNWLAAKAAEYGDAGVAMLAMKVFSKASAEDRRAHELAALEARLRRDKSDENLDLGEALDAEGIADD